ncbi:hypothetical protein KEJ17_06280 [Candidatus Bathyarchaeota archaeon]|nr:hypothetical protein [Candidatus Bathyarchaeota archaeon]
MDITVTESQLKLVLQKLDAVKLELLRLRAILLPEEEKKRLREARKEISEGSTITLKN